MIELELEHKELFNGTRLEMGKILWYLQKAKTVMDSKMWVKNDLSVVHTLDLTDFGREMNPDEIHWWIFKRETDIEELREKTDEVLSCVQNLKTHSLELKKRCFPESYHDLIQELKHFAELYKKEINALHDYVVWLHKKDVLAPSILFNYRIWGSTRLSDRHMIIVSNTIDDESMILEKCTEIAFGLAYKNGYKLDSVYMDMSYDIWDSDPEKSNQIEVSAKILIARTSSQILDEFAIFIECIRNSLRNIILDIDGYDSINKLLCGPPKKRSGLGKPLAFISHDSRDKHIASLIAVGLTDMKCSVWYDEYILKVGDNLRDSIDKGLKECTKCILILSPNFLSNNGWTKNEFDSIFTREMIENKNIIVPIWLGVDKEEIFEYCPSLANRFAANWDLGKDKVIKMLQESIVGDE